VIVQKQAKFAVTLGNVQRDGPADILDGRTLYVELLMTEWQMAFFLSIPIPIATPTPIALRRCLDRVV
jgi:hypothetical protein